MPLLQVSDWVIDETILLVVTLAVGLVVFSVLVGVLRRVLAWLRPPVDRTGDSKPQPPVWASLAVVWTLASLVPLFLLTINVMFLHLVDALAMWLTITAATAWPLVFFVGLDARVVRKRGSQSRHTGAQSVFELLYWGLNTKARRERAAEFRRSRPLTFWTARVGYSGGLLVPHLAVVVAAWYLLWARPRALRAERKHRAAEEPGPSAKTATRKRRPGTTTPAAGRSRSHPVKADGRSATESAVPTPPPTTEEAAPEQTPDDLYSRVIRLRAKGERAAETGRYDDALSAWRQAIAFCERAAGSTDSPDVVDDFRRLRSRLESNITATERRKAAAELEAAERSARDALVTADGLLEDGSFTDATEAYERARAVLGRLGALGEGLGRERTIDVEASLERVERGRVDATVGALESRVVAGETALEAKDTEAAMVVFREVLDEVDDPGDIEADDRVGALSERARVGHITATARSQLASMIEAEVLFDEGNPFQARDHYRRIESAITALAPSALDFPEVHAELRAIADACEWNVDVTRRAIWEDDDRTLVTAEDVRNGWRPPAPKTTVDAVIATLDGYSLTGQLGGGGFADVYEVRADDGLQAALKIPRMQFDETVPESKVRLFDAEAANWRAVSDHPNVVDVLGYGDKPVPWLLLERCTESLRGRVGTLSTEQALDVIVGIGGALDHANGKGIVHLDVKPENVLFDLEGVAKLGDWGLSKVVVDGTITAPGLSNRYAAPEQLDRTLGQRNVRTDVYQYGVLAYELLTGQHPFEVGSREDVVPPSELNPELPSPVDAALLRALEPHPEARYEQVVQVRDALVRAMGVEA